MPDKEQQWYTNKELFEMMQGLSKEMHDTRIAVKRYNGIREELIVIKQGQDAQIARCNEVQTKKEHSANLANWALRLWPVALSAVMLLMSIFGW